MKFIIFGSDGFIGTHLCDYLEAKNESINHIYKLDLRHEKKGSKFCDIRIPIHFDIEFPSNSVIFNLAAIHTTPGHPDNDYFETNIKGAQNITNFARENNINTIVFTSSIAPYGASEDLKSEDTLPTPNTPYGISKLVAEHIHRTWQAEDVENRKLIIVRPGVVFGKNEGGNFSRLYSAMNKGYFFYPGREDTQKACVYVKDVVRILYETALNEPHGVSTYNLTYDPAPTIKNICTTIAEVTNLSPPKIVIPSSILKKGATVISILGPFLGKRFAGIHPARVKKLMISTNINGHKLSQSSYKLRYTLEEAVRDWHQDTDKTGLV
jgi:nucleoside-diphosphate-sugar epimerase